jgi:hypothetical protein
MQRVYPWRLATGAARSWDGRRIGPAGAGSSRVARRCPAVGQPAGPSPRPFPGGVSMSRRSSVWLLFLALFAAPAAAAQAPKPGEFYEDAANLGFKMKMPDKWDFVPGTPSDPNLIGSYRAGARTGVLFTSSNTYWPYEAWLVKFERQPESKDSGEKERDEPPERFTQKPKKDVREWLQGGGVGIRGWDKPVETKEIVVNKVPATEYVFKVEEDQVEVAVYACVFKLKPDVDVAFVLNGPGEDKKWNKFESAARALVKTFKPIGTVDVVSDTTGGLKGTYRDQKRRELQQKIASQPGWKLYETPNYFIVSNSDDEEFVAELMERLEAIRKVYEELYPKSMADEMRKLAAAAREKKAAEEPSDEEELEKALRRTIAQPADPMEMSRSSVVRVCQNREQYRQYGGSPTSAGYWYFVEEELVLYDDQEGGGRNSTWAVVNHEAFHQYVFYFFGNISPHSWNNEGNGDFFSGYEYNNKKFTLNKFNWRDQTAKTSIREGNFVPLKDLVRFTQGEYYNTNKYGTDGGQNYAQGWSFIYFLRTGEKNAKGWNPAWGTILDTYLRTLIETDDLDAAVEKAFAGVDWDALEKCWAEYTLKV